MPGVIDYPTVHALLDTAGDARAFLAGDGAVGDLFIVTDRDGERIVVRLMAEPGAGSALRGIVHLSHGVGEHSGRYWHVARALGEGGYAVIADDHRGHGLTALLAKREGRGGLSKLGPRGIAGALDAVDEVGRLIRQRYSLERPHPVIMLGHSWGSLMAQKLMWRDGGLYDGYVLSGSTLAIPGPMNIGNLNREFERPGCNKSEWLTRDEAEQLRASADPLVFFIDEQPAWRPWEALGLIGLPARSLHRHPRVLVMVGQRDALGGERGARMLVRQLRERSKLRDVTLRVYEGARHEVFNELEPTRQQALDDLAGWLTARW